jgi:hypothetical protein
MARSVASAAQILANWQAAAGGIGGQKMAAGIQRTTVNPMALAAADDKLALYAQKCQASVTSGRRKAKLLAADPNLWKTNASTFGVQNWQASFQKAKVKMQNAFNKWQPIYQQASDAAAAVPKSAGLANAAARQQAAMKVLMDAAGTT